MANGIVQILREDIYYFYIVLTTKHPKGGMSIK